LSEPRANIKRRAGRVDEQALLKQQAAEQAVGYVTSGMVVGLGSGSTVKFALEFLGAAVKSGKLERIVGIPSSRQTEGLANTLGIPLTTFEEHPRIDLTIDGADEVDPGLNLIKGGGGALLREKIVAQASKRNIIIVDESKLSPKLGTVWAVPIEVIPFALAVEMDFLQSLGARPILREEGDKSPFITDEGNRILDAHFGPIEDVQGLAHQLNQRAGIVEHGLFLGMAAEVIVAEKKGIRRITPPNP
jgi:ribose 5-phosphate isomerase A